MNANMVNGENFRTTTYLVFSGVNADGVEVQIRRASHPRFQWVIVAYGRLQYAVEGDFAAACDDVKQWGVWADPSLVKQVGAGTDVHASDRQRLDSGAIKNAPGTLTAYYVSK